MKMTRNVLMTFIVLASVQSFADPLLITADQLRSCENIKIATSHDSLEFEIAFNSIFSGPLRPHNPEKMVALEEYSWGGSMMSAVLGVGNQIDDENIVPLINAMHELSAFPGFSWSCFPN